MFEEIAKMKQSSYNHTYYLCISQLVYYVHVLSQERVFLKHQIWIWQEGELFIFYSITSVLFGRVYVLQINWSLFCYGCVASLSGFGFILRSSSRPIHFLWVFVSGYSTQKWRYCLSCLHTCLQPFLKDQTIVWIPIMAFTLNDRQYTSW